jgi:transposase
VPVLPSSLLEPLWVQFSALIDTRPEFAASHPWGCHRRRIPDRLVFEHVIAALVHGSGYERIASPGCSDRTIRRRLAEWAAAGIAQQVHAIAVAAFDTMIGLHLNDLSLDGAITKAPTPGAYAGPSPVDRGKHGLKRSTIVEAHGIPLGIVAAAANRHDSPLLTPTLHAMVNQIRWIPEHVTVHLDAAYDNTPTRESLHEIGFHAHIARKGIPAPIQASTRWVVERSHAWINSYGKIRRCTDRQPAIVEFYLYLAATLVTIQQLIHHARTHYRWPNRPTTRRLK